MKLVVDANIVISALISSKGRTRELLLNDSLELYSPSYLKEEIEEHKDELVKKSGLKKDNIDSAIEILIQNVIFVSNEYYKKEIKEAEEFSLDPDDTHYLALASFHSSSLWSNDKRLQKQNKVKVFGTTQLIDMFYPRKS